MSIGQLEGLAEQMNAPVFDHDHWNQQLQKSPFAYYDTEALKHALQCLNRPHSSLSRAGMVDALHRLTSAEIPKRVILDSDQTNAVKMSMGKGGLLIYGPPGSGKTTTLCEIVRLGINESLRVLCLQYNVNAETTMANRLRAVGCPVQKIFSTPQRRSRMRLVDQMGCFVSTFDKYAAQRCPFYHHEGQHGECYGEDASSSENPTDQVEHIGFTSYESRFRQALKAPVQEWEKHWDYVIVDEMQDVSNLHIQLVQQLQGYAKTHIYAGDPRQEIYRNTGFMTQYWQNADAAGFRKCVLRYNHRSSRAIVAALNAFSRHHFGDLHVEQLVPEHNREVGSVRGVICKQSEGVATCVAKFVLSENNGASEHASVISPVSVQKYYDTQDIVTNLRQQICEMSDGAIYGNVLHGHVGLCSTKGEIHIGTSYAFKGSENERVAVMQADVPYDTLNLSREETIRLLYVALSRARRHLLVALGARVREEGLLACIRSHLNVSVRKEQPSPRRLPRDLAVRDDIAQRLLFPVRCEALVECTGLPPVTTECPGAQDYLGIVVEGQCARTMGIPVPATILLLKQDEDAPPVCYIKDEKLVVQCRSQLHALIRRIAAESSCAEKMLSKIQWTLRAGREWTLGDDIRSQPIADALTPFAQQMPPAVCRSHHFEAALCAHRSGGEEMGFVVGVTDIETEQDIIEVKHTRRAADVQEEARQVAAYASLSGKGAVLYRTRQGEAYRVHAPERAWMLLMCRATLGLKQAQFKRGQVRKRRDLHSWSQIVVSVDVEYAPNEFAPELLEIGAVAFRRDTCVPVDAFHCVNRSVRPLDATPDGARATQAEYYGFCSESIAQNNAAIQQDRGRMLGRFHEWLTKFPGADILQFGGNDAAMLQITDRTMQCGRKLFRAWLGTVHDGVSRMIHTSLDDSIQQILGERLFVPHRAYEDAVACAMLVTALSL